MDYAIANNARLFDELSAVLERHRDDPGVAEALAHLKAARENYVHRSLDHTLNNLVLALHDLIALAPPIQGELIDVLSRFVQAIFETPARLRRLAEEYERDGGRPLSADEILREVDERRGLRG